jgi:hypothetical protein
MMLLLARTPQCHFLPPSPKSGPISVNALPARGLVVRYISENQLEDVDGIRQFDLDGYGFCEDKSNGNVIVFDRRKNWKDGEEKESSGIKKRKVRRDPKSLVLARRQDDDFSASRSCVHEGLDRLPSVPFKGVAVKGWGKAS